MGGARWPRRVRLRKRPEIVRVQRGGRRVRARAFSLCVSPNELGHARVALTVSRKVGGAVVRNRVKRRLREALRRVVHALGSWDVVVLAAPGIDLVDPEELARQITAAVSSLRRGAEAGGPG